MYHHFDVVMLAPDMAYRLEFEDNDDGPTVISSFDAPSAISRSTSRSRGLRPNCSECSPRPETEG